LHSKPYCGRNIRSKARRNVNFDGSELGNRNLMDSKHRRQYDEKRHQYQPNASHINPPLNDRTQYNNKEKQVQTITFFRSKIAELAIGTSAASSGSEDEMDLIAIVYSTCQTFSTDSLLVYQNDMRIQRP
jgi:hypothetical protein